MRDTPGQNKANWDAMADIWFGTTARRHTDALSHRRRAAPLPGYIRAPIPYFPAESVYKRRKALLYKSPRLASRWRTG